MVHRRCQTAEHENTLMDHIMSSVRGLAADILPLYPESIDQITTILLRKIKPDTSEEVKGRLMALKSDHSNMTDFAKKVEKLGNE